MPTSILTGSTDLAQGFFYNLPSAVKLFNSFFVLHNILWIFLILSGLFLFPWIKIPARLTLLMIGSIGALMISLFFILPGYPAELFSRLWVLTFIIGTSIGGYYLISLKKISAKLSRLYIIICSSIFLLSGAWWVIKYVPDSMNSRNEIITEGSIIRNFAKIPYTTSILYAEADITLQTSILLGGDTFGALVYPMLKGTIDLPRLIEKRRPEVLLTLPNPNLNSLSQAKAKKFLKRLQGLSFEYVKEFNINRENGQPLDKVLLNIKNLSLSDSYISWSAVGQNDEILDHGNLKILNNQTMLNLPTNTKTLRISLPKISAWLIGISFPNNKSGGLWPWNSGWTLNYELRNKKKNEISIKFSLIDLLKQSDAEDLIDYVNLENPIISDDGGLIFIRTIFNRGI